MCWIAKNSLCLFMLCSMSWLICMQAFLCFLLQDFSLLIAFSYLSLASLLWVLECKQSTHWCCKFLLCCSQKHYSREPWKLHLPLSFLSRGDCSMQAQTACAVAFVELLNEVHKGSLQSRGHYGDAQSFHWKGPQHVQISINALPAVQLNFHFLHLLFGFYFPNHTMQPTAIVLHMDTCLSTFLYIGFQL